MKQNIFKKPVTLLSLGCMMLVIGAVIIIIAIFLFFSKHHYGRSHDNPFFPSVHLPTFSEKEPNNSFDQATYILFGSAVNGRLSSNDVDFYKVEVPFPLNIEIAVKQLRAGNTIIIYNDKKAIVASIIYSGVSDNNAFVKLTNAGTYFIEISLYGNENSAIPYSFTITPFP